MAKHTQRVTLTEDDLYFICESISCNIPCSDDMTPAELETYNKLRNAEDHLRRKNGVL